MAKKHPKITKSNGELVPFDAGKLRASLQRAGASNSLSKRISEQVKSMLYPGIPTAEIYNLAYDLLRADGQRNAGRYRLKQALLELGPSGFPFEHYVAALLQAQGFSVQLDQILPGKCVHHELDVVAHKGNEMRLVECKYHSQRGQKSDVKISLYVHARMQDLEQNMQLKHPQHIPHFQPWLVTNTRFSDDAMLYGRCAGMHLVSWDYPAIGSLKDMIESSGLYPITCLGTLFEDEKSRLAEKNVILCRDLRDNVKAMHKIGMSDERIANVLEESDKILSEIELQRPN